MRRVAECVSTDVRLKKMHKGRKRQQRFVFDEVSKTVRSKYYTNYSLTIPNQGRNKQLRVTTTNSRWW